MLRKLRTALAAARKGHIAARRIRPWVLAALIPFAGALPVGAGSLRAVADIPPVAALVAQVMGQGADVALILRPGGSPHGASLRPSQARALSRADLVVWVGPALSPGLAGPMRTLAPRAVRLQLLAVSGTHLLRASGEGDGDEHSGEIDPHAWLDPENGKLWLDAIAGALADIDPGQAERYRRNAARGKERIDRAVARVAARLGPVAGRPYITQHDAYRYFETRFGLRNIGSVTATDATPAGAARLARLRDAVARQGVRCGFHQPGTSPALLMAVADDLRVSVLDPLGVDLLPGPDLYPQLLLQMADTIADCLASAG